MKMNRKYELTSETKEVDGAILHRIRALRDFGNVKAGDVGGWVESESNLSHYGRCWIYDDAVASEHALLCGNVVLSGNARASGHTRLSGNVWLADNSHASGYTRLSGNAWLCGNERINID